MLQIRLRTGMCETLMLDAVAPQAHQNDHSYYVSSVIYFQFTTQKFSLVSSHTEDLKTPQKLSTLGGGHLLQTIRYATAAYVKHVLFREVE